MRCFSFIFLLRAKTIILKAVCVCECVCVCVSVCVCECVWVSVWKGDKKFFESYYVQLSR